MFGMGEMPWDTEVDGKTLEDALMDSALQTAALYALLPGLAEQEGAAASPDVDQRAEEALERERERAEKERDRMGRVYQTLSLAGGAFLVILLL